MRRLASLIYSAIDLCFPPYCGGCGDLRDMAVLCARCRLEIKPVISINLPLSTRQKISVMAVGGYTGPLVRLILGKARGDRLAARELGFLMAERLSKVSESIDYIVPVPLHWTRRVWRGYDQVRESGYAVSAVSKIPMVNAVRRVKKTEFQSLLSPTQRVANCSGAFMLTRSGEKLRNKHILIIDDVMTTGATISEVIHVIMRVRPASVRILVGARVVD